MNVPNSLTLLRVLFAVIVLHCPALFLTKYVTMAVHNRWHTQD